MSAERRKRIILAGIIGRYPVGGVTWCALHYIAGFQALGYDVFYLEDTAECGYDPIQNGLSTDPSYALRYIRRHLAIVGLEDSWAFVDHTERPHGRSFAELAEISRSAELLVNLSGGVWRLRPEYDEVPKIFIDTDPSFTQLAATRADSGWSSDFFTGHRMLFTFALNVNRPGCRLPETPFRWHPTIQPLVRRFWPAVPAPSEAPYTTVLSWRSGSFPGIGKGKSETLTRMIDLPRKLPRRLLLAIGGQAPMDLLARYGWETTDAVAATIDPFAYRAFIQGSRAEIGFAKPMYVETRSGWFSDRSECYLATGRPALVHDTGFGAALPTGEGLLTFSDEAGIIAGIDDIESDYGRHSRRAAEIGGEFFDAEKVLDALLRAAGVR